MKDEKEMNSSNENEESLEASLDKTEDYEQNQLNDELEKLAETFRVELKKAKESGEIKVSDNEVVDENDNAIPEEELCECCGERRKDKTISESYEYCEVCRERMKRYPINFASVIIAISVILVSVLGVTGFISDFSGYNLAKSARDCDKKSEISTAISFYDSSIAFFEDKDIVPKALYKDSAVDVFAVLPQGVVSFYDVSQRVEKALSDFEAKLPIYNGYEELRNKALIMYDTYYAFYTILRNDEYADFDPENKEMINDIYAEVGKLNGQEYTIESMSGEKEKVTYDETMILFSQYMFLSAYGDYNQAYECIKQIREKYPEYIQMYGYDLATIEIQYGNYKTAIELADALKANNAEDSSPYILYAYKERMAGEHEKAIEFVNQGLKVDAEATELYRQKAIALLLMGKKDEALKEIKTAFECEQYGVLYFTYLVIATEAGAEEQVEEITKIIEESGLETPEKIQKYLDGKLSYKKLFTEGTGDIE